MSKTRPENDDNDHEETQIRDLPNTNSAFIDLDTSARAHIVLDYEVKNWNGDLTILL